MRAVHGLALACAGIAAGLAGAAAGQQTAYPTRTVTIVVPYTRTRSMNAPMRGKRW
jgi:tripartite-type tricarboxylate transporter receptor subunit TctC